MLLGILFVIALVLWLKHRHTVAFEAVTIVSLLAAVVFALEAAVKRYYVYEIALVVVSLLFLISAVLYQRKAIQKSNSQLLRMVAKSSPYGAAVVSKVLYPALKEMDKKKAQLQKDIETVRLIRDKMRDRYSRMKIEESHLKEYTKDFIREKTELLKRREECYEETKKLDEMKKRLHEETTVAEDKLSKIGDYEERLEEVNVLGQVLDEERKILYKKMNDMKKLEKKLARQKKRANRKVKAKKVDKKKIIRKVKGKKVRRKKK